MKLPSAWTWFRWLPFRLSKLPFFGRSSFFLLLCSFSGKKNDSIVPGFMQAIFYRTETNGNQVSPGFWFRLCSVGGREKVQRQYRSGPEAVTGLL